MSNIGSYEERLRKFDWSLAENELGYRDGDIINIGWYCSDRICQKGEGGKIALYFEDFEGLGKKYTYNDIRLASNTIGTFLGNLGLRNEDRICFFLDRIPELYFSFLGILKIGAIVQPLFSAFGDESLFVRLEDAQTRAIITQRKHLPKVRRVRDRLPYLEYIIVVDHLKTKKLENKEIAFKPGWPSMMRAYWNNEEKYREKFVNGWYISGDKATSDNEGYFWFIGRDDDIINTGGHLVSPFEVESALLEHPAVGESAVVSKPDDINMEVVKAFITL